MKKKQKNAVMMKSAPIPGLKRLAQKLRIFDRHITNAVKTLEQTELLMKRYNLPGKEALMQLAGKRKMKSAEPQAPAKKRMGKKSKGDAAELPTATYC